MPQNVARHRQRVAVWRGSEGVEESLRLRAGLRRNCALTREAGKRPKRSGLPMQAEGARCSAEMMESVNAENPSVNFVLKIEPFNNFYNILQAFT